MRFWGAVTPSVFASGTPWDRCEFDAAGLTLRAGLRRATHLERRQVDQVIVGRRRCPPFLWRTTVEFVVRGTSIDREHLAWQLAGSRRFVYNRLLDGVHDRMTAWMWEAELGRANKALARTKPGSNGHRRAVDKLRRLHARVHGLRQDVLHQVSTWLVDRHGTVVVEDLNVAGMLADRRLALGAADSAMAALRQLLTYKAAWYGTDLVVADRFYPSSKTCSTPGCGHVYAGLGRGESRWRCPRCGIDHDRDHNAAVNLARWPTRNQPQAA